MRKFFSIAAPLVLAAVAGVSLAGGPVTSEFATGTDGWQVRGPAVGPTWEGDDGDPPGSISAVTAGTGGDWYWKAPVSYHGNRLDCYGRTLRYSVKHEPMSFGDPQDESQDDIVLRGGGLTLSFDDESPVMPMWTGRYIPLHENAGWAKRSGTMRMPATRADLQTVLGSLNSLEIRGGSGGAAMKGYLDNVGLNAPMWVRGR